MAILWAAILDDSPLLKFFRSTSRAEEPFKKLLTQQVARDAEAYELLSKTMTTAKDYEIASTRLSELHVALGEVALSSNSVDEKATATLQLRQSVSLFEGIQRLSSRAH